jgi:hypothetical protein
MAAAAADTDLVCERCHLSQSKWTVCECKAAFYCDVGCQLDHWHIHKQSCKVHIAKIPTWNLLEKKITLYRTDIDKVSYVRGKEHEEWLSKRQQIRAFKAAVPSNELNDTMMRILELTVSGGTTADVIVKEVQDTVVERWLKPLMASKSATTS